MDIASLYKIYLQHPSVQTDTRRLQPGDLFFALRGPQFNGNAFAAAALEAGAAFAVIDDPAFAIEGKTILTGDVLSTLQQLALHHRRQFSIPFLAITGSNGKTTTKELIHAVLSSTLRTSTTTGNLNNHIGIPLTLLRIPADAEIAVVEMGANHQREIAAYCTYTLPTHGLITNCGKAHLEGFGGEEGVRRGKGELYDHLRSQQGTVFLMKDYDYLRDMSRGIAHSVTYGTADADVTGRVSAHEPFLEVEITKGPVTGLIRTRLVGAYNLPNVLAAVAVGIHFGIPAESIRKAIEGYTPTNSRSQWMTKGSNHIVLDAYNANPSSMKLAIENFAALQAENKVLVLGAMAELGTESRNEHAALVELMGQHPWKAVLLVGGDFLAVEHPYLSFTRVEEAAEWLQKHSFENTHFLIKGSRSMQMEKTVNAL